MSAPEHRTDLAPVVDIRPILRALLARWWWVVVGAVVGGLAGIAIWNVRGVTYEAIATLAVNQPRSAPPGTTTMPTANYRALLENYSVAASVIKTTGLDKGPKPIEPERFMRDVLSVEEIRGTNLIRIHVRLEDPALAAKVAQDVASRAVELSRRINEEEGAALRDRLQSQQEEALNRFKAAEQHLIEFKRSSHIEELAAEATSLIQQREKLLGVEVDLTSERGRASAAEKERSGRRAVDTFARTFEDSPTLTEAARAQAGGDLKTILGLALKVEAPNPTYDALDREVALARTKIAQLEQQRQQILNSSAGFTRDGKLEAWYQQTIQALGLEADRLLARKVYEEVALRYEQAKVVVTSGSAQLQIVDAAFALPTPVSWSLALASLVGVLVGGAVPLAILLLIALARLLRSSFGDASLV